MSKIIVLLVVLCTFCIKNDATQLHMKNKIQKHLTQTSESEDECDSNIFLIISRKTGYNLTLAYQVFNENGNNYYWVKQNICFNNFSLSNSKK